MEIIKNVQTILRILFEHKDEIFIVIIVSAFLNVVIECFIKIVKYSQSDNDKENNNGPFRK